MENYVNKIAVVTGANSGIGAGISKELVKRGCIVVGIARRLDKLQLVKEEINQKRSGTKGAFHPLQCDVTDEQQLEDAFIQIQKNYGIPSILVNNAGVSVLKKLDDMDAKTFDHVMGINAKALLLAMKLVLRMMSENSVAGHILNINSICGQYLPITDYSIVYSGSKSVTKVFTEGIREMINDKRLNIKISNISPGIVRTPLVENDPILKNLKVTMLSVDDVVKACITILDTPPDVLISELTIMAIHQVTKRMPQHS